MKSIVLSFVTFTFLLGALSLAGFVYALEPGPEGRVRYLKTSVKLLMYKYSLVDVLTQREIKRLYKYTCTKKCHSSGVIKEKLHTSMEWNQIVERMGKPERADLSFNEKRVITEYLQKKYLSNVPTILSDHTMRFLKKHLWRMDFGDEDLYFDLIYMPMNMRRFMPYLAARAKPTDSAGAVFIAYLNTHSGSIPDWDLSKMATLKDGKGNEWRATNWQVLYEDVDHHHRQGVLTFPAIDKGGSSMELQLHPKSMRPRTYSWSLPIPPYREPPKQTGARTGQ